MRLEATEIHALGHSCGIGEAEDTGPLPGGEVYSGDNDDETPENLYTLSADDWSIMRSGWEDDLLFTHNGTKFHVCSIEELTTASEPR